MASNARRRTLGELQTLYRLHPKLRDVFVEGQSDARFLRHHLGSTLDSTARVTAVSSSVDVPNDLLVARGLEIGERNRLVVMSEIVESWRMAEPVVTCIVDSDWELIQKTLPDRPSLLATDYPSIEVYGLLSRPLQKFLDFVGSSDRDYQEVVDSLAHLWRTLYVLRYVLHMEHSVHLNDRFIRRCHVRGAEVTIDVEELIRISMQGRPPATHRAVADAMMRARANLDARPLESIRGHDIAPVLIWFLQLTGDFRHETTVEVILMSCIETADLAGQPMFAALKSRLGQAA